MSDGTRNYYMGPPKAWFQLPSGKLAQYVSFDGNGPREQGAAVKTHSTHSEALLAVSAATDKYIAENEGTVFWRVLPEVDYNEGEFRGRARLVVVDEMPSIEIYRL